MHKDFSEPQDRIFLGIETSCDETAVALVSGALSKNSYPKGHILAHKIHSQVALHQSFGGVVPPVAASSHSLQLPALVKRLLQTAEIKPHQIDGIGVTAGPGLAGGLLVGVMFAKGLSIALKRPLWPIHHLQAHALVARLTHEIPFPYLVLLLSGGHCQLAVANSPRDFTLIGESTDDAPGECLDKVARCLGYSYPGGPSIEAAAKRGDPFSVPLPIAVSEHSYNFSFSGLKTACLRWIKQQQDLSFEKKADLCASLQNAITYSLGKKVSQFLSALPPASRPAFAVVCGGVASNGYIRQELAPYFQNYGVSLIAPPAQHCTDNGVMIAWATYEQSFAGMEGQFNFSTRARWPINDHSLQRAKYSG